MAQGLYIRGLCCLYEGELLKAQAELKKCLTLLLAFVDKAQSPDAELGTLDFNMLINSSGYFITLIDAQLLLDAIYHIER